MDVHRKKPYSAIDPGAPDICPRYQMTVTPLNTIPFHMLR